MYTYLKCVGGCVLAGVVLAAAGCSQSELLKKDQQIQSLTENWQQAETDLLGSIEENEHLKARLAEANEQVRETNSTLGKTKQSLSSRITRNNELVNTVKVLREKHYDLEMMYETLSNRITALKAEIADKEKQLSSSQDEIASLTRRIRKVSDEKKEAVAEQQEKVKTAEAQSAKLAGTIKNLEVTNDRLKKEKTLLVEKANERDALASSLKSLQMKQTRTAALFAAEKQQTAKLARKITSITEAASTAGVTIPEEVTLPSDWETVVNIAKKRVEAAKEGSIQWDNVDIAAVSTAGGFVFLLFLSFVFAISSVRSKRKLKRLMQSVEHPVTQDEADGDDYAADDHSDDTEAVDEEFQDQYIEYEEETRTEIPPVENTVPDAVTQMVDRQAPVPENGEPSTAEQFQAPVQPEEVETVLRKFPEEETSDVQTTGEEEMDDLANTQIISSFLDEEEEPKTKEAEVQASEREKKPSAVPGDEKDEMLGDLRSVINKKFDELLKE